MNEAKKAGRWANKNLLGGEHNVELNNMDKDLNIHVDHFKKNMKKSGYNKDTIHHHIEKHGLDPHNVTADDLNY